MLGDLEAKPSHYHAKYRQISQQITTHSLLQVSNSVQILV